MNQEQPEPEKTKKGPSGRVGKIQADYSIAMSKKYGRYPTPKGAKPLPGHEDDVIPDCPDYAGMKESEFNRLALNREDERRRLVPSLPRRLRLLTWSRQRRRGFDVFGET